MFSDLSFATTLLGLAGLLLLGRIVCQLLQKNIERLPPGPKPLPLICNLHQVPKSLSRFPYYQWSKEYGPIMYMSMAGQSFVILSSNQTAQDLLSKRSTHYSDRPRMVMAGELVTKGIHMLFREYNTQYRLHRRLEAPLFNVRSAQFYRPLQDFESRQLLFDAISDYDTHGDKGIDPHHHYERATAFGSLPSFSLHRIGAMHGCKGQPITGAAAVLTNAIYTSQGVPCVFLRIHIVFRPGGFGLTAATVGVVERHKLPGYLPLEFIRAAETAPRQAPGATPKQAPRSNPRTGRRLGNRSTSPALMGHTNIECPGIL